MRNFLIVSNTTKDPDGNCAQTVRRMLDNNGCRCTGCVYSTADGSGKCFYIDPAGVPDDTEAVLALGGDGTLIHVLKEMQGSGIPVYGINFGTLGFLTEVGPDEFEDALSLIIQDKYHITNQIMLESHVIREGRVIGQGLSLNDVTVNRSLSTSIANFNVCVDGVFLNEYASDGIIIATPTGSTGYNLSAGGPVVQPTAEIILVTPLAAHTLNSRSIVFPASVTVDLELSRTSREKPVFAYAGFDGEDVIRIEEGDRISIKMAPERAKLLRTKKTSFIETIGKKMR